MEILKLTLLFTFFSLAQVFAQNKYDVILTELLADPSPQIFLPNAEFIEIYNTTNQDIKLKNWTLSDPSSTITFPDTIIKPKEYITLCHNKHYDQFSKLGKTIPLSSFPTLNNSGDTLTIRDDKNNIIHSVAYADDWYNNSEKQKGGWSLEMIDMSKPCIGENNWTASTDNRGGTPSEQNSTEKKLAPLPFALTHQHTTDSKTIHITLNQELTSFTISPLSDYSIDTTIIPTKTPNQLYIKLNENLKPNQLITIQLNNIENCTQTNGKVSFEIGLNDSLQPYNFIINEILFNPITGGVDFIEIKNISNKLLSLTQLSLAQKNTLNSIDKVYHININKLVKPNEILALTGDKSVLITTHHPKYPENVIETKLPSLLNETGNIILLNNSGQIIDELNYSEDWHFSFLKDKNGVSLERINSSNLTNDEHNWFSASSQVNYATPTEENSQRFTANVTGGISLVSHAISPDQNGENDQLIIQYEYKQNDLLLNAKIFNRSGLLVKQLINNESLNSTGQITWSGQTDNNTKAPLGIYILVWQITDSTGNTTITKETFSIGAKL